MNCKENVYSFGMIRKFHNLCLKVKKIVFSVLFRRYSYVFKYYQNLHCFTFSRRYSEINTKAHCQRFHEGIATLLNLSVKTYFFTF